MDAFLEKVVAFASLLLSGVLINEKPNEMSDRTHHASTNNLNVWVNHELVVQW